MKKLFITGGSGDIGKSIINLFRTRDFEVIAPTSKELDLASIGTIDAYFADKEIDADCFIHCAGINLPKKIDEINDEVFFKTLTINSVSFFKIVQKLVPSLTRNQGTVLAVASIYGVISRPGRLAYSASKHALIGMAQTLALELGPKKIRVNALSPGFIETSLTHQNNSPEVIQDLILSIPLGRLGTVNDVAEAAYFLCSPQSAYFNGQNIIMDGGYLAGGFQD